MSFGFSVTDVCMCGKIAYDLYRFFKDGPSQCADFAKDLEHFSVIVDRAVWIFQFEESSLTLREKRIIQDVVSDCWAFLWTHILVGRQWGMSMLGNRDVFPGHRDVLPGQHTPTSFIRFIGFRRMEGFLHQAALRFRQAGQASKLKEYQEQLQRLANKLLAMEVLNLYSRVESVSRGLSVHIQQISESLAENQRHQVMWQHKLLDMSSDLIQSQSTMQQQLQEIIASNRRRSSPFIAQSLDASSPEGRETWMMLGRLLRDEGITPSQIRAHRGELVTAMKATMAAFSQASNSPSSFYTAAETDYVSLDDTIGDATCNGDQIAVLSSKPREGSYFPSSLTDVARSVPGAWEEVGNIHIGVSSLLEGMEISDEVSEERDYDVFGFQVLIQGS